MNGIKHVLVGVSQAGDAVFEKAKVEIQKFLKEKGIDADVRRARSLSVEGERFDLLFYPLRLKFRGLTLDRLTEALQKAVSGEEVEIDESLPSEKMIPLNQKRIILEHVGIIDPESIDEYIEAGGYQALRKALSMKPEEVIETVKASGLRGRGGAGFPTGLKWEFTAKAEGKPKYVLANADESEPGTFKDRVIEEGDPHRLIEGIVIAAYAIGASQGYVFVRGEHTVSIKRLQKAVKDAYERGFLGENIMDSGFSFELKLARSAGGYICGEETALIEALEGKRGQPRVKPPYPPQQGLWGKPTLVNNVETLSSVPPIILNGAEWFRGFGTENSPGTKIYSVLGHTVHTGFFEAELGITLRELIFDYGGGIKNGRKFKAALVGGAAGAFIDDLDIKLDFDSLKAVGGMLGSGAVLVMSDEADPVDVLLSVVRFFSRESCGKCVPCRVGTRMLVEMISKMKNGECRRDDLDRMLKVAEYMKLTSFCPLGQSVYPPLKSAMEIFRPQFEGLCKN